MSQTCVVTLEPVANELAERVDVSSRRKRPTAMLVGRQLNLPSANELEPLTGGVVDLGALATEFLILGLDPYPRKPGRRIFSHPRKPPQTKLHFQRSPRLKKARMLTNDGCFQMLSRYCRCRPRFRLR